MTVRSTPPLHAPLFDDAARRATRTAVVWPRGCLTHGELAHGARRVAGRLGALGIGAGERVALCLPKSAEAVQTILGVLTAGAAYVPLDTLLPAARLCRIVADSRARLMITTAAVQARLARIAESALLPPVAPVDVTASGHGLDAWLAGAPLADPAPVAADQLAALLYTSGSTGTPKGVMLSHGNVASFVRWARERFALAADDRFASHAPLHFDLSMLDLFASLDAGAAVVLIDEKTARFPAAVVRAAAEHRCTVWYSVPTALHGMLERGGLSATALRDLRLVLFAGEVFPLPGLRKLMRTLPAPRYVNLYGPTETNVCTYHVLPGPPAESATEIPIGVPCEHLEVQIRGADDRPTVAGATGEICVAGPGVMQGYWDRPDATAAARAGGRADSYRTGDLGVMGGDGLLYYRGRRDHQVKIRGHRIELLEIEGVLASHPDVARAAVVWHAEDPLAGRLVAFVTPASGALPATDQLRRHCAAELPAYGVPASFVVLEDLPVTSRGKLDRALLSRHAAHAAPPRA